MEHKMHWLLGERMFFSTRTQRGSIRAVHMVPGRIEGQLEIDGPYGPRFYRVTFTLDHTNNSLEISQGARIDFGPLVFDVRWLAEVLKWLVENPRIAAIDERDPYEGPWAWER